MRGRGFVIAAQQPLLRRDQQRVADTAADITIAAVGDLADACGIAQAFAGAPVDSPPARLATALDAALLARKRLDVRRAAPMQAKFASRRPRVDAEPHMHPFHPGFVAERIVRRRWSGRGPKAQHRRDQAARPR